MKYLTTILSLVSLFVVSSLVTIFATSVNVSAANASNFNPGNIIDDAVFYNSQSIDVSQIQQFLNAKVPSCDTQGTRSASDWGYPNITHAQLAEYKRNGTNGFKQDSGFHAPPYTCLRDHTQDTPDMEAASGLCGPMTGGVRSSAQIIKDVASACGINPKVLIVLLEKEQSLVTDNWPLQRQYRNATGFACPDTAPCNPAYNGFFYQVYHAARQFKVYQSYPNSYNYIAGRMNRVYWQTNLGSFVNPTGNATDPSRNGQSACGYSSIYIENQATAALYIYTPYQPNQSALSNLYGTGDGCSAYGNRNFWRIFTDWFGTTHSQASFTKLDTVRWMRVPENLYKKDVNTGESVGFELWSGLDIKFTSKSYVNGVLYLRSEYDTSHGNSYGIPFSSLLEIGATETPHYIARATKNQVKINPVTGISSQHAISVGEVFPIDKMITVDNKLYYRTIGTENNSANWIISDALEISSYVAFDKPRYLHIKNDTSLINPSTGSILSTFAKNQQLFFDAKVYLNGKLYYRTESDTNQFVSSGVLASDLEDISFTSLASPTLLTVKKTAIKMRIDTGELEGTIVQPGRTIRVTDQITVNDKTYFRTEYDNSATNLIGIPTDAFSGIQYVSMDQPRTMALKSATPKFNPFNLQVWEREFPSSTVINFDQKIYLGGKLYLRSSYDHRWSNDAIIPYELLRDV